MHGVTVGVGGFRERRRGCPRVRAALSLPTAVDSSWLRVGVGLGVGVELGVRLGVEVGLGLGPGLGLGLGLELPGAASGVGAAPQPPQWATPRAWMVKGGGIGGFGGG
eukprot:scaffold30296_cov54-Phaeocystis_antarctica.AAC.1